MKWRPPLSNPGANNRYRNGDPTIGQWGSVPDAEFFNMLLDELDAIRAAMGLSENDADNTQLIQALRRMVPCRNGSQVITGTTALTASEQGKILMLSTNDFGVTLPALADVGEGATYTFVKVSGSSQTIAAAAGETINGATDAVTVAGDYQAMTVVSTDDGWLASGTSGTSSASGSTLLLKTSAQAFALNTNQAITWDSAARDAAGAWSAANPTRLTVPDWATVVRVTANIGMETDNRVSSRQARIVKNGVPNVNGDDIYGMPRQSLTNGYQASLGYLAGDILGVASPELPVVPGDYFEVWVYIGSSYSVTAQLSAMSVNNVNWFAMDVVR